MHSSTWQVILVTAILAALLVVSPPASSAVEDLRLLDNRDWEAPIVGGDGIQTDSIQGILDDDPLGLVPKTPFVQRYSLDTDNWEVWLCGPVTDSMETVLANLRSATVDYYEAISGGIYTPSFTAGGSLPADPYCLSGFEGNNPPYSPVGTPEGLLIIDTVTGGGYASPGVVCGGTGTDCPLIGQTFPDNARYAILGQGMVSNPSVVVHELGHTLQWPHSFSGASGSEYDNPIDVMSGNSDRVGVQMTEPNPYATLSYNRYQSGWVSPSDVVVANGNDQSMTLQPFNVNGTQLLAVKTATAGQFYVFGARRSSTYDPIPLAWEGVEVYLVDHACGDPIFGGVCPGIWREQHQQPPVPYQVDHVLTQGASIDLEGLTITVTAATATGYTVEIDSPNPAIAPTAPAPPAATSDDGSVSLTWSEPSNGGSQIVNYDVQVENHSTGGMTLNDVGLTLATTVNGLTNGDDHRARVRAVNAVGDGDWSSWSANFTPSTVPAAPGIPTGQVFDGSVTFSWAAPSSDGGSTIASYGLQVENQTTGLDSDIDAGALRTVLFPATNGNTYRARARAINDAGTGLWSDWSLSFTPTATAPPPPPPPPPPSSDRFIDDNDSMFEADIEWLADAGITQGCNPPTNDRYCPTATVTRGQMAAFLSRALGLTDRGDSDFADDNGSVFESEIEKLATAGVTRGCDDAGTRFCPDDNVTRGQMAAFLVRALGLTATGNVDFSDDDQSIFESEIEKLATAGITKGCNDTGTRFCPNDPVTRGQMAAFLRRALA